MEDNYYPSNIPEPIIVEHLRFLDKLNPYNAKHYHNFYEIYFLIEGDVNFFIDNKTYPISPFNVVFISPQTLHKALIQNKFPYERVVIYFNSDIIIDNNILKKFHQNNKVISLSSKVSKNIIKMICLMIKEANNRDDFHLPYLQSLLNELIIMILRNCRYVTANKVNANFNAIVDYIKNHYKESITLKSVADKFYMNSSYLSRIFKKNTGFSFNEYVNYQRIFSAQDLLKNTTKQITDIAISVGFDSSTHFGRVFKQLTGFTPSAYRKLYSN